MFCSIRAFPGLTLTGPWTTSSGAMKIVVVDVLTACLPAAVRQTISRAQSMNRLTAGLRVRSLSVTTAAGHGRTGSSNGEYLEPGLFTAEAQVCARICGEVVETSAKHAKCPVRLASYGVVVSNGNGCHPMSCPGQLGCCSVAPLRPHKRGRHQ